MIKKKKNRNFIKDTNIHINNIEKSIFKSFE